MFVLKQSTTFEVTFFAHDANGDAVTGMSDGGFTKRIKKAGGSFGALSVTIAEDEGGWYDFTLSTSDTNTLGLLTIYLTNASCEQINLQYRVAARINDDFAWPTTSGRSIDVATDGAVEANVVQLSGDAVAADNLELDYDGTGYAKANSTIGTTTTNTDMRGTDNAALASVLGALTDAAAADDPTTADTAMQYIKQLVNVLVGTAGVATFPAEAAPGNAVSLAEVIRAIHTDVTGLNGSAMRGTDSAALASVCTEARLAELDAANLVADVAALPTAAEVNAEVVYVMSVDTVALPGQGAPPATPTRDQAILYPYKNWRNKKTTTATLETLFADDGTTADQKSTLSDDATTFTKAEVVTGA